MPIQTIFLINATEYLVNAAISIPRYQLILNHDDTTFEVVLRKVEMSDKGYSTDFDRMTTK